MAFAYGCNCGGPWAARPLVLGADAAALPGTVNYQVRPFEPAFISGKQMVSAIPYSPALISAVSPVYGAGAAAAAGYSATGAAVDVVATSKCCGAAYSPLPPSAVQAWGGVIGCGGQCLQPGTSLEYLARTNGSPFFGVQRM